VPLPTQVIVIVNPEAMDVVNSWKSSIHAFTPASNPVKDLKGLTAESVGFWNNSKLGANLFKEVVKIFKADGEPKDNGLYGCPNAATVFVECPNVSIYFTDDSIDSVVGGAMVIFQSSSVLPTAASASVSPTHGRWSGRAEFGTFVFTVNPQGTGVTYIKYTFSNYNCGGAIQSGSVGNGEETGWDGVPISNGQFTFKGATMTIQGTFDSSGKSASGTWTYPECSSSGKWTAVPSK
jgi:hypothetical protein